MMAASTAEPAVGASTCASGNQVCTGHIGILTAKATRKAMKIHSCASGPSARSCRPSTEKEPASRPIQISATSMNTEPRKV